MPVPARPARGRPLLSHDRIVDTALELLHGLALKELTMRRLAQALDTTPAALYGYFRSQEELFAEIKASQPPLARWSKQLEDFAAQFERNRKTLYDIQELEQQVRQQGNEMAELQRLAVERQRTELREWQDNQVRVDDEQTARVVRLESWQTKSTTTWQSLEDRIEQNKQGIQACSAELWQVWTRFIQAQAKVLDGLKQEKPH